MNTEIKSHLTAADIKQMARALGISDLGICSAEPDYALLARLPDGKTPFVAPAKERIAPRSVLSSAKSVIVGAFHYANPPQAKANISCYAWIADYHSVIKEYLTRLLENIRKSAPQTEGYIFTDSSPLCDKALAYRAGLGYFGKNSLLLHPKFGSLFFIGGIVTNLELTPDAPRNGDCGSCSACKDACPAGLCGTGSLDGNQCISYLQQKKGVLTEAEAKLIRKSGSAWGCDLCQLVCPKNQVQAKTSIPEFTAIDSYLPSDITEAQFKAYKNRAFHWRGYKTLKRNLDIINCDETQCKLD